MSARHQLIGGAKVVAVLAIAFISAAWGRGMSLQGYEAAMAARCDTFQPFALGGQSFICLSKDGVIDLIQRYEAKKKSEKETPL